MYCKKHTETLYISLVFCRKVYYIVSLFGRVHCQRFYCMYTAVYYISDCSYV